MVWVLLISCAGEPGTSKAEQKVALEAAEARIVALETEVEGYRRRMASIERLDAAMEKAHTHVEVRCTSKDGNSGATKAHYSVSQAGWQEMTNDPHAVVAQGRWIPHGDIEQPTGWRLVRHARGGLLDSCGLKTADVLQAINGVSMVSEEGPSSALAKAVADSQLQIELLRNRTPFTVTIEQIKN